MIYRSENHECREKKARCLQDRTPKDRIRTHSTVADDTGCWNWQGAVRNKTGPKQYGVLCVGSQLDGTYQRMAAHRYSYESFIGPIPHGLCVLHHCDNPRCVNPAHLYAGTKKDNATDMASRGRNHRFPVGANNFNAKLNIFNVSEIRQGLKGGETASSLANRFGVSLNAIYSIKSGRTWKHVPVGERKE